LNLRSLISQADSNSYYSRSDADKYSAANSAGWQIFSAVQRENRGFFIKFDTTSITLTPGQQTYTLPPDFSQLLHFAERAVATDNWHPLGTVSIGVALDYAQQRTGWYPGAYYGNQSQFSYDGPYLPAPTVNVDDQVFQMDIAPAIDRVRMTELVYIAKWIPITDDQSVVMLPDEAYAPWLSLTTANLLDMNDDTREARTRARTFLPSGGYGPEMQQLLSWVRNRQIQNPPTVDVFSEGY
jgi:hypothetical protein